MNGRLICIVVATSAILILIPSLIYTGRFFSDDCFFYVQIAMNIYNGDGSTFNNIFNTNGYHPLWMLFCVISAYLSRGDRDTMIYIVNLAGLAFLILSSILFIKFMKKTTIGHGLIGSSVFVFAFISAANGSEANLTLFCLAILFLMFPLEEEARLDRTFTLGISMGAVILARLDTIFLCLSLSALKIYRTTTKEGVVRAFADAIVLGISAATLVLPYLLWNWSHFGHLVPISGAIKSSLPRLVFQVDNLGTLGQMGSVGAVVTLIIATRGGFPQIFRPVAVAWSIGILTHSLYIVAMTDHDTQWSWYYVPAVMNIGMLFSFVTSALERRFQAFSSTFQAAVAAAVVLLAVPFEIRAWLKAGDSYRIALYPHLSFHPPLTSPEAYRTEAAKLTTLLPESARLFVQGAPGAIAFFGEIPVFAADGLTNNYKSDSELLKLGPSFLPKYGICYGLFSHEEVSDGKFELIAPYSHVRVGEINLRKARRIYDFMDGKINADDVLFQFDCDT